MTRIVTSIARPTACLAALALCAFVGGCAAPTRIATNKDASYQSEPKRLFMMANVVSGFGREFADAFNAKMTSIVKSCGADIEISEPSNLDLDKNVHANRMRAFKADSLMLIRRAGGTVTQYGLLIHAIYDVELISVDDNRTVWRANVSFNRGGTALPISGRAEVLAIDITNALKLDKVFKSCAPITTDSAAVIDRRQSASQPRLEPSQQPSARSERPGPLNLDGLKDLIPAQ